MNYRHALKQDLQGILGLYAELHPNEESLSRDKAEALWDGIGSSDHCTCFVAESGGEIVATCTISIIPNLTRNGRPFAVIENVITSRKFRRKGVGRSIINCAIDHARQKNCYKLMLMSNSKRADAHQFYTSIGFDGDSKRAFEMRFL